MQLIQLVQLFFAKFQCGRPALQLRQFRQSIGFQSQVGIANGYVQMIASNQIEARYPTGRSNPARMPAPTAISTIPTPRMNVLGVTGSAFSATGERYFSQSVSRLKNLSAPARNAVVPRLMRKAVASLSISS